VPFESLATVSYSHSIVTIAIYVSFASYSDLLVENGEFFIPHLYLVEMLDGVTTRMIGLPYGEKTMTIC